MAQRVERAAGLERPKVLPPAEAPDTTEGKSADPGTLPEEQPEDAAAFFIDKPLDDRLKNIEAGIAGLGGASAGTLKRTDQSLIKKEAQKRALEAFGLFKELKNPAMPMQVGDIVKSIANGIDDGSVKPTPEILNWLMGMAPKYLEAPTPRSMAMQAAATTLMTGIARVGQSMSGKMLGPDAAGATALTGMKYIKAEIEQDKQLTYDVAVKNADIFNKYRDDVVRLAIEVDKQNTEREKARLEMFKDGIKNQVEIYKEEGRRYVAEKKELGRMSTDFLGTAESAERGELDRASKESISEYETKADVSIANLNARVSALRFRLDSEKMRQDNMINLDDEMADRAAAVVQILGEAGVDESLFNFNVKMPRGEYERNIPVASILGSGLADAIGEFSRSQSVFKFGSTQKGELTNLVNQIGRGGRRGIFIDPSKIRNLSAADMEFFADITGDRILLDAKSTKELGSGLLANPDTYLRMQAGLTSGLVGLKMKRAQTQDPVEGSDLDQKINQMETKLRKVGALASVRTQSEAVNLSNQMMMVMANKLGKKDAAVDLTRGIFNDEELYKQVDEELKNNPPAGKKK